MKGKKGGPARFPEGKGECSAQGERGNWPGGGMLVSRTVGLAIQSIRGRIRTGEGIRCGRWIGSLVKEVEDVDRVGIVDDSIVIDVRCVCALDGSAISEQQL